MDNIKEFKRLFLLLNVSLHKLETNNSYDIITQIRELLPNITLYDMCVIINDIGHDGILYINIPFDMDDKNLHTRMMLLLRHICKDYDVAGQSRFMTQVINHHTQQINSYRIMNGLHRTMFFTANYNFTDVVPNILAFDAYQPYLVSNHGAKLYISPNNCMGGDDIRVEFDGYVIYDNEFHHYNINGELIESKPIFQDMFQTVYSL